MMAQGGSIRARTWERAVHVFARRVGSLAGEAAAREGQISH
jgi:hypothetical protein